jgi:putative two-component system response regulator
MSRILAIDDEDVVRMLVVEILESVGHEVVGAESAEHALDLLDQGEFDLIVSDVVMPGLSGLELLEAARRRHASLPVVLVTGAGTYETLSQALTRGAAGLVTKPFAHAELQTAVSEALERATEDIETVRLGAILHDVGKIGIPDRVLLKPGPLDEEERRIIETHTEIGDKLLEPLDLLAAARPIVRHHHERWDGAGYPDGLAAEAIPAGARIVAVADSVEAMTSRQLYRKPLESGEIIAELQKHRGRQWDPAVVDVVLRLIASGELVLAQGGLRLLEPAR